MGLFRLPELLDATLQLFFLRNGIEKGLGFGLLSTR